MHSSDFAFECQFTALDFHALGLNLLPIQEDTKKPALATFAWWQYDRQEADDVTRVVHSRAGGLAALGGISSGNAFFLDCETPECFRDFSGSVTTEYGSHAAVSSHRGGHCWLRAPFPVQSHSYGDYEIKGQGNYVLAPPSIHPSGSDYQFTSASRRIPLVGSLPFITLEPKFVPRVSRFAHDLFRGRESRPYSSRSERDQAFVLSLVRSGFDQTTIGKAISIAQFDSKYRELLNDDEKAAAQYLDLSFKKALSHPESERVIEAQSIVQEWERWAMAEKWTGRTGAVDRVVFLAHLYCANTAACLVYSASVRQLAELAQTGIATVSHSTRRLADLGVLKLYEKGKGLDAHRFTLHRDPPKTESANTKHPDFKNRTSGSMSMCSDLALDAFSSVWEWRGLGKTARLIWESLSHVRKDYQAISEESGRGLRTVKRYMPTLIDLGIADKTDEGYMQAQHINWSLIAKHLMVQNIQAERMVKHLNQRARFRERIEASEI